MRLCWQFRVINSNGSVFGEDKIYYTPQAAHTAGRDWIEHEYETMIWLSEVDIFVLYDESNVRNHLPAFGLKGDRAITASASLITD